MESRQNSPSQLRHASSLGIALAVLGWGLLSFVEAKNADWLAYQYLFDEAGGWLANAGRDPGFLALLTVTSQVASYEGFRVLVGLYFLAFTWWLVGNWKGLAVVDRYLLSYVAALPLLFPRFTVQIREGIAITLVLAALTILWKRETAGRSGLSLALTLMCVATAFHGSAAVFVVLLMAPRAWLFLFGRGSLLFALLVLSVGAFMLVGALSVGLLDAAAVSIVQLVWGGFVSLENEASADKGAYWLIRCALAIYLIVAARPVIAQAPRSLAAFLRLSTYMVMPLLHLMVLYLLFGGHSAYLTSSAIRMLNMVVLLLLAIIGFRARKSLPLLAVVLFMLLDQIRVLVSNAPEAT
jgi:hypothetical protein